MYNLKVCIISLGYGQLNKHTDRKVVGNIVLSINIISIFIIIIIIIIIIIFVIIIIIISCTYIIIIIISSSSSSSSNNSSIANMYLNVFILETFNEPLLKVVITKC